VVEAQELGIIGVAVQPQRIGGGVEGGEGVQANAGNGASPVTPVQVVAKPVRTAGDSGDSFLTRIGRKIRRMLSGS